METEILDDISMCLAHTGLYYIFLSFLWKRQDINLLLQDLQDYKEFGKPKDAENINKQLNFYTKIYYWYCEAGIIFYFVFVHTIGAKACKARNKELGSNEVCGFFAPIWLPFNYSSTPLYEIVLIIQLLSSLYSGPVITVSFMIFVIVQHVCCKIRHLKNLIIELFLSRRCIKKKNHLIRIIRYHQFIIR